MDEVSQVNGGIAPSSRMSAKPRSLFNLSPDSLTSSRWRDCATPDLSVAFDTATRHPQSTDTSTPDRAAEAPFALAHLVTYQFDAAASAESARRWRPAGTKCCSRNRHWRPRSRPLSTPTSKRSAEPTTRMCRVPRHCYRAGAWRVSAVDVHGRVVV